MERYDNRTNIRVRSYPAKHRSPFVWTRDMMFHVGVVIVSKNRLFVPRSSRASHMRGKVHIHIRYEL